MLKLLACIAIVMHHYSQYGLDWHKISGPFYEVLRSVGGDLSVTLFFFLSGYGLMVSESKREFSIKRFADKRFWRILKPFWIVNLAAVIIYWILDANSIATQSIWHAVGAVLGIFRFDPTMWFIHYLLALYILFAIGMLLKKPVLFVVGSVLLFVVIAATNGMPSHAWSSLFAFPLGMAVGMNPDKLMRFFRRYDVALISCALYITILYFFVFKSPGGNGPLWHQANNILLIILLLFALSRIPVKYFTWYKLPAKYQPYYEVYLVHPKILFIMIFSFGIFLPLWVFIPLTLIIALIFCNISSISTSKKLTTITHENRNTDSSWKS